MALTYAEQNNLANNVAWQGRVAAAVADVAQSTIRTLPNTDPNETQLKNLAVDALRDPSLTVTFARLVSAGLPPAVVLATPPENTATDVQIRAQVRNAFDALVIRR